MIQWLLFIPLAVYFMLDAYHTQLLLGHGHVEMNFLLRPMIEEAGIWLLYVYKLCWLVLLGCYLYKRGEKNGTNQTTRQHHHAGP